MCPINVLTFSCSISSWVQGFSNKNLAFINNQTVCYPCGNYILFLDIETKKTRAVQCQAGQVGAFAASANSQVVAFSDRKLNPLIHIYTFPELSKLTELKGTDVVTLIIIISLKQYFNHQFLKSWGFFIRLEKQGLFVPVTCPVTVS